MRTDCFRIYRLDLPQNRRQDEHLFAHSCWTFGIFLNLLILLLKLTFLVFTLENQTRDYLEKPGIVIGSGIIPLGRNLARFRFPKLLQCAIFALNALKHNCKYSRSSTLTSLILTLSRNHVNNKDERL